MQETNNTFPIVTTYILLVGFVIIVVFSVFVRGWLGDKFSISTTDLVFGLIPIAIWLLSTGKIAKFEYGGMKFEAVFTNAKKSTISSEITKISEITKLPIEHIPISRKAGVK